jgi:hypothetical protein
MSELTCLCFQLCVGLYSDVSVPMVLASYFLLLQKGFFPRGHHWHAQSYDPTLRYVANAASKAHWADQGLNPLLSLFLRPQMRALISL